MTPTVFGDIDGVLNHAKLYAALPQGTPPGPAWLDPACVARLDALCRRSGAVLVGISAWPIYLAGRGGVLAALQALVLAGFTTPVIDWIPTTCPAEVRPEDHPARWEAVQGWLSEHPDVVRWAIVDDRPWRGFPADRTVQPDAAIGLTDADCGRVAEILGAP